MLSILPFFIVAGFAIGFEASQNFENVAGTPARFQISALLLLLLLLFVGPQIYVATESLSARGNLLLLAGAGIGVAAGFWFDAHKKGSDRLILLSAAAFFILLSALDYEIKIFDRLTSFGAAGVSLSLSEGGRAGGEGDAGSQPQLIADQGGPFRGAARLDFALSQLGKLGENMLRDEQYAHVFASDPAIPNGDTLRSALAQDRPALALAAENCVVARRLSKTFQVMQDYLRSESPTSAQIQEQVYRLTVSYFANDSSPAEGFKGLVDALAQLENIANLQRNSFLKDGPFQKFATDWDNGKPDLCNYIAADDLPSLTEAVRFPVADPKSSLRRLYLAYHGLVVALAQYAVGNREGAIQFLDRLIAIQSEALDEAEKKLTEPSDCAPDNARCFIEKRLDLFRRRVTVARLENMQDGLMDAWGDQSINPERLKMLGDMIDRFGAAMERVRPEDVVTPTLFRHDPKHWANCTDKMPGDILAKSLIARWSVVRTVAIASALDIVGADSNLLRVYPSLGDRMDAAADYIEHYDVKCPPLYGYKDLNDSAPAELLRSAGDYWSSRSAAYRESSTQADDTGPAIAALCKAIADYQRASELASDVNLQTDVKDTRLDNASTYIATKLLPVRLANSIKRSTDFRDKHYPAGDIDKACSKS